jgi:hypothetical protein
MQALGIKSEYFYRYGPRAVRLRVLECEQALALRAQLAGLLKVVRAF